MHSQAERDSEEEINKNERAAGILFQEESYEELQTKITPTNQQCKKQEATKPPIPVFMAFHPSADILLILSTPEVTFLCSLLTFSLSLQHST